MCGFLTRIIVTYAYICFSINSITAHALYFYVRNRALRKAIYFIGGVLLAFGFAYLLMDSSLQFGVAGKLANKSGSSRVLSMLMAYDLLLLKPFIGHGFHSFRGTLLFENVNLITASAEIGIIGILLYIIPYLFIGIRLFKDKQGYFFVILNLFLLVLFSQPVYFLPISIWMLAIGKFMSENNMFFRKVLILR